MYLRPAYEFPHTMPETTNTGRPQYGESKDREAKSVSSTGPGVISRPEDLDAYAWPDPANDDYYEPLKEAATCLAPGMGLVSGVGGIFTRAWMLLGLEQFCFALAEQPDLVAEIFRRVGSIQCETLRRVVKLERVVAVWCGDDLAYTESTMVSPRVYRKYLFPWMEELAAIAHGAGLPFIFHSDGKLWDVIPDLIAVGVDALHPIEPKAMDINLVKARYGNKLALIGNIDMNLLSLGTPDQVREQVRQRIKDLRPAADMPWGRTRVFPITCAPKTTTLCAGPYSSLEPIPSKEFSLSKAEPRGVIVPAIAPVNDREEADEAAFRKPLRRLIKAGVHGAGKRLPDPARRPSPRACLDSSGISCGGRIPVPQGEAIIVLVPLDLVLRRALGVEGLVSVNLRTFGTLDFQSEPWNWKPPHAVSNAIGPCVRTMDPDF